jgi:hypothetical protein
MNPVRVRDKANLLQRGGEPEMPTISAGDNVFRDAFYLKFKRLESGRDICQVLRCLICDE